MADGADQKEMKKRLKKLMNIPENQICSDCNERQPRWASLIVPPPGAPEGTSAIGAFCCLECSGSHRRLGVHISFVRSINLDSWKEKEVIAMENGGNAKVNAIFESSLSTSGVVKPTNHADGPTRERFIRDKYERRKFYNPRAFAEYDQAQAKASAPRKFVGDIVLPALDSSPAPAVSSSQASEAARKRVEERKDRFRKCESSVDSGNHDFGASFAVEQRPPRRRTHSAETGRRKTPKAPMSAPVPVADLLDFDTSPDPVVNSDEKRNNHDFIDLLSSNNDTGFNLMEQAPAAPAFPNNAFPDDKFSSADSPLKQSRSLKPPSRTRSPRPSNRSDSPKPLSSIKSPSAPTSPDGKEKPRRTKSGKLSRSRSGEGRRSDKRSEDILALYNTPPVVQPAVGPDLSTMSIMMQQMNVSQSLDGNSMGNNMMMHNPMQQTHYTMPVSQVDFTTLSPHQQRVMMQHYQQQQMMMMQQQTNPGMMMNMRMPNAMPLTMDMNPSSNMSNTGSNGFGAFVSAPMPPPPYSDSQRSSIKSSSQPTKRDPFADLGR